MAFCFLTIAAHGQRASVEDLFTILNSTKDEADILLKSKGYTLKEVDLKTGIVKGGSVFWRNEGWVENGEQTLFQYTGSDDYYDAFGFYWDKKRSRLDEMCLSAKWTDSVYLKEAIKKYKLVELTRTPDEQVYTNETFDYFLLDMGSIGNDCRLISILSKESSQGRWFYERYEKVRRKLKKR